MTAKATVTAIDICPDDHVTVVTLALDPLAKASVMDYDLASMAEFIGAWGQDGDRAWVALRGACQVQTWDRIGMKQHKGDA